MENKKLDKILVAVLVGLLVSSSYALLSGWQPPAVSAQTNYGDIMQYDWPASGYDEGNTGSNPGPGPDRPNVLWSVTGRGSGMVSAFDGKVFTTSGTTVYATDAFTGSLIYTSLAPDTPAPHNLNGVHKLDGTYFVTVGRGGVTVRRIATGELVATSVTPYPSNMAGSSGYFAGKYSNSMKMYFDHAVDPITHENQIVAHDVSDPLNPKVAWKYVADISSETLCCGDGKLFLGSTEATVYALDRNGNRVWQTSTLGGLVQQSAIYYNGKLYTSAVSWQITCFDGATGKILWQADKGVRAFSAYRGAAGAGMIFESTVELDPYGTIGAWDAETGERLWKQPGYFNIHYATMAYADGKVYGLKCDRTGSTGGLVMPGPSTSCWDAYTGTELWNLPGISFSTPSIAYGNLYGVAGNRLYCIGGAPKDWNNGFQGTVENPRIAVGQQGPKDISTPKWEYQTGGDVFSSPAVVAGKVYVGSHDKNWYCLDANTGEKIWNFTVGHYVRTSAAVAGGKVFTGADDGYFYCLDGITGAQVWKTSAGGHFPKYLDPNEAELRSSPIVVGDKVYAGSLDGKVYCLNTANGLVSWTYPTGGPITGSPAYSNGAIYIASTDSFMYALNAATGALQWKSFPLNMSISIGTTARVEFYNMGTPTVAAGRVFIGGGVQYGEAMTGINYTAMNMSTPVGANGGGIRFFAFNATTGASIWNISRSGNTQPIYVPAYWNGQIYAPEFFEVTAMNANNPGAGKYLPPDFVYSNRINGNRTMGQWVGYQVTGSIAYADDLTGPKIYVGSDIGTMYCLNATDGSTYSLFTSGGNMASSPAVWDGKLYVGSTTGKVSCFDDSPMVDFNVYAAANKGEVMWNNETISIGGRLTANPMMMTWDYDAKAFLPEASEYHPGLPNAAVVVSFTKPDGTSFNVTQTTDKEGDFVVSYSPKEVGNWGWVAYYEGKRMDGLTYNAAYNQFNMINVVAAPNAPTPTSTPVTTSTPTPTQTPAATSTPVVTPSPEATATPTVNLGFPMEYVYAIIAVIVIAIVAIVAFVFLKGKKTTQ